MSHHGPSTGLPEFLTIAEAAEHLRVTPRTIHRLIARKELPVQRVGRAVRISVAAVRHYLML